MSQQIKWPAAVYFDTSILRKLPSGLSSSDLAHLKNSATELSIGLYAPEVAASEWVAYHQMEGRKKHGELTSHARSPLTLSARVVWSGLLGGERTPDGERHFIYQSGLVFVDLSTEQQAALARILQRLTRQAKGADEIAHQQKGHAHGR
ncbi:MAG: hypothetical protein ACHQ7N_08935 [Candidatus Methylomirabilales bacterium]